MDNKDRKRSLYAMLITSMRPICNECLKMDHNCKMVTVYMCCKSAWHQGNHIIKMPLGKAEKYELKAIGHHKNSNFVMLGTLAQKHNKTYT